MEEAKEKILTWTEEMHAYQTPTWDSLPQIPLYLDQVVGFLESQLQGLLLDEEEKTITPSMVNNYVKKGVIPPPVKKKYDSGHLARLLSIYPIKQILPINQIAKFLNHFVTEENTREVLEQYRERQDEALHGVAQRLTEELAGAENDELETLLRDLVLDFVLQANAMRMAAECIIAALPEKRKGKK